MRQAVILAAGKGTRLRPITDRRSKAMVPVAGQPLVDRALEPLLVNGVEDLIVVVSPQDDAIVGHLGSSSGSGRSVHFVIQDRRLGTAHALALAAPLIKGQFALWACDSIVDTAHVRELLLAARGADAVLSLLDREPEQAVRSAVVRLDGARVRGIVEKPPLSTVTRPCTISLPHYVLGPGVLPLLGEVPLSPRGEHEMQEAIQRWIELGAEVTGVRTSRRLQVSDADELLALNRWMLREEPDHGLSPMADVGESVRVIPPSRVEAGATIGDGAVIGPESYLESGSLVGAGARVRRSMVLRDAVVEKGAVIRDAVISPPAGP